jgi:hypothetical protein
MAKRTPQRQPPPNDDAIRAKGFTPFIRAEHTSDGEWFRLTGLNQLRRRDDGTEQINCEIENETGEQFTLGVRLGTPDYRKMFHALGREWRTWTGGIAVTLQRGSRGGIFVNVKDADRQGPIWDGPPPESGDREPGQD